MLIDVNLRPNLNHKGIVSKNLNGVWNVVCVERLETNPKGAEMAGEICSMLGFSGYSFFNVTPVTTGGFKGTGRHNATTAQKQQRFYRHEFTYFDQPMRYLRKRHNDPNDFWSVVTSDMSNGIHFSEMVGVPRQCLGFYIECVPHAVLPVVIPLPDGIRPHPHKHTPPKPMDAVKPIIPVVQPHKAPTVIVPPDTTPKVPSFEAREDEHFPWSASIYINGQFACNGILFDRIWIGVEGSCVASVKYEFTVSKFKSFP